MLAFVDIAHIIQKPFLLSYTTLPFSTLFTIIHEKHDDIYPRSWLTQPVTSSLLPLFQKQYIIEALAEKPGYESPVKMKSHTILR